MFGVVHYVRGEGVEREHVGDFGLLLALHLFHLFNHVGVDNLVMGQEVMPDFLLCKVELHHKFPSLINNLR